MRPSRILLLLRSLEANVPGVSWGTYRCEKWGKKQASAGNGERGVGHINHIHIGLTNAGPARRTSFWSVAR